MATLPINKVHRIGILKDIEPYELPYQAFSGGINVRFTRDGVTKFPGWREVYASPTSGDSPIWMFDWQSEAGSLFWFYATGDKLVRMNNSAHVDVSQSGGYNGTVDTIYSGGVFNGVPIINNDTFQDVPQMYDSASGVFKDLTNWTANLHCKVFGFYDSIMIAANLNDNSTLLPDTLQWSTPADPGSVPSSWDYTSTSNIAGRTPLSRTGGEILAYRQLGEYGLFYKSDAFVRMRFVGGEFIFDFDWLTLEYGILGPYCAAEFEGKNFIVTRGHLVVTDGGQVQEVGEDKNTRYLFNSMNQDEIDKTFVAANYPENEMMICYVNESEDPTATFPNHALVWNWKYDTWTFRELGGFNFIAFGIVDTSSESKIINDQDQIINQDDSKIDAKAYTPSEIHALACSSADEKFYRLDDSNQHDGTDFDAEVERIAIPLIGQDENEEPMVWPQANKFIRRIYPLIEASASVDFFFGVQRILGGPIDWKGPFSFDPNTQRKIDIRLNGKYLAVRIRSQGNVNWTYRGILIDLDDIGEGVR